MKHNLVATWAFVVCVSCVLAGVNGVPVGTIPQRSYQYGGIVALTQ